MPLRENFGFRDWSDVELGVFLMGINSRTGMNHFNDGEVSSHNT